MVYADISNSFRRMIQQGLIARIGKLFHCSECMVSYPSLNDLDAHFKEVHSRKSEEMEKVEIDMSAYLSEIHRLLTDCAFRALESIDISSNNVWLIPEKENEKVIDYIWVKDEMEAFLLQVNVSTAHQISDHDYLLKIRDTLRLRCPDIKVHYVVLVPTNVTFRYTKRQQEIQQEKRISFGWARIQSESLAIFKGR